MVHNILSKALCIYLCIQMHMSLAFLVAGPPTSSIMIMKARTTSPVLLQALSNKYFENDLVSVQMDESIKLYVVRSDSTITPVCTHADDNPTDFYIDPRSRDGLNIDDDRVIKYYGEGWYSQRVVPSLGGGPGYGAEADDVWSIEEQILEELLADGVEIPTLDLGIAHGEKARGGAI